MKTQENRPSSCKVLTHPVFDRPPVENVRRPGRKKGVISLYSFQRRRGEAMTQADRDAQTHQREGEDSVSHSLGTTKNCSAKETRRRNVPPRFDSIVDLPFVADIGRGVSRRRSFWDVPPTDDWCNAVALGQRYAADFVEYLKQHRGEAGGQLIGLFIEDMKKCPKGSATQGYAVGFFSLLESVLSGAVNSGVDHYAFAERAEQRYASLKTWLEKEDA